MSKRAVLLAASRIISTLSHMLEAKGEERGRPPIIAGVHSPILAFCGTREGGSSEAALETIAPQADSAASVDRETLAGADHFYTGHEADAATLIARWVSTRL
ncbi:MAG: hypothetical protein ACLQUY_06165 [Ktedonobacterales bacterium]